MNARDRLIDTVHIAGIVPRLNNDEMYALFDVASQITGTIVEIGCAYGGSAVCMAMAAPTAHLILVDNFTFTKYGPTSEEILRNNLVRAGVKASQFKVLAIDSMNLPHLVCELAHIDGNHSYAYVKNDLHAVIGAPVIVCHDYVNEKQPGVKHAVDEFIKTSGYRIDYTVSRMAVLKCQQS